VNESIDPDFFNDTAGSVPPRRRVRRIVQAAAVPTAAALALAGCSDDKGPDYAPTAAGVTDCPPNVQDIAPDGVRIAPSPAASATDINGHPARPETLPQVGARFVETDLDTTMARDFSTPQDAMNNASFGGETVVKNIDYTLDGIVVTVQVAEQPKVNRTTANVGDQFKVCYPHRLAHQAQADGNESLVLLVDPRYDLPPAVGEELDVLLDMNGNLVPFLGSQAFDDDMLVSFRDPNILYPAMYMAMARHYYGGTPFITDPNSFRPGMKTSLNLRRSKLDSTLKTAAQQWAKKHDGLSPSKAYKVTPAVTPTAGGNGKSSTPSAGKGKAQTTPAAKPTSSAPAAPAPRRTRSLGH
jgi:hypothetical protein